MAAVLRRFRSAYIRQFGANAPRIHFKVMGDIEACRTPVLGGREVACGSCGLIDELYHSCRNRSCPKCSGRDNEKWRLARHQQLLPVRYHLVTFTIPSKIRRIVRRLQRKLYGALMKAAVKTLTTCLQKRYGFTVPAMAVLHTWTRKLTYHPHVHILVPAGGITPQGQWKEVDGPYLVPGQWLGKVFRAKFLQAARRAVPGLHFSGSDVATKKWVVDVQKPTDGPDRIIKYLAAYIHRAALSDHRILAITDTHVTFKVRSDDRKSWDKCTVTGHEFIRRVLQHVLPPRFHKVRYYGLWSPGCLRRLIALKARLEARQQEPNQPNQQPEQTHKEEPVSPWQRCPHCQCGRRVVLADLPKRPRTYPPPRPPP